MSQLQVANSIGELSEVVRLNGASASSSFGPLLSTCLILSWRRGMEITRRGAPRLFRIALRVLGKPVARGACHHGTRSDAN